MMIIYYILLLDIYGITLYTYIIYIYKKIEIRSFLLQFIYYNNDKIYLMKEKRGNLA